MSISQKAAVPDSRARAAASLARSAARRIVAHSPTYGGAKVEVDRLACELGVEVTAQERLYSPARWHQSVHRPEEGALRLWDPPESTIDRVEVRAGLRDATRRFALAHELGHVVLHREHTALARSFGEHDAEHFANAFAAELLVPPPLRCKLRSRFRSATDPVELLRLGDFAGVPPRTLLRFARSEQWLRGTDVVWLDVRRLLNRFTGRDRCLRIYDAVFDRSSWFLPTNRSIAGVFGSDRRLSELRSGVIEMEARIELNRRSNGPGPRFRRTSHIVLLKALRLHRARDGHGLEIVALAHPLDDRIPAIEANR